MVDGVTMVSGKLMTGKRTDRVCAGSGAARLAVAARARIRRFIGVLHNELVSSVAVLNLSVQFGKWKMNPSVHFLPLRRQRGDLDWNHSKKGAPSCCPP